MKKNTLWALVILMGILTISYGITQYGNVFNPLVADLNGGGFAISNITTIDTGQGAVECYAMNQDARTSDNVTFLGLTLTKGVNASTGVFTTGVDIGGNFGELLDVTGNTAIGRTQTSFNQGALWFMTGATYKWATGLRADTTAYTIYDNVNSKYALRIDHLTDDWYIGDGANISTWTTTALTTPQNVVISQPAADTKNFWVNNTLANAGAVAGLRLTTDGGNTYFQRTSLSNATPDTLKWYEEGSIMIQSVGGITFSDLANVVRTTAAANGNWNFPGQIDVSGNVKSSSAVFTNQNGIKLDLSQGSLGGKTTNYYMYLNATNYWNGVNYLYADRIYPASMIMYNGSSWAGIIGNAGGATPAFVVGSGYVGVSTQVATAGREVWRVTYGDNAQIKMGWGTYGESIYDVVTASFSLATGGVMQVSTMTISDCLKLPAAAAPGVNTALFTNCPGAGFATPAWIPVMVNGVAYYIPAVAR